MVDKILQQALVEIREAPRLRPFLDSLAEKLEAARDGMEKAPSEDQFRTNQGKARALRDILEEIASAK